MPTPSLILVPARFKTGKLYTPVATTSGGTVLGASGDFNVTRNTTATRVNASGLIESVASGIPRLDYYTSGGTAGCPALLVEPSGSNLALQSQDFSTTWGLVRINAFGSGSVANTTGTLDPYGTNLADYLQENTAVADTHRIQQNVAVVSGTTYTMSCFLKSAERFQAALFVPQGGVSRYVVFNLASGTATATNATGSIENYGNGWYRGRATFTATASGNVAPALYLCDDSGNISYTGTGTKGIYAFGFQFEASPIATSYIPTTTAAVTRNADVINVSGAVSGCIGQTEGTIYAEVDLRAFASSAARRIVNMRVDGNNLLSLEVSTAGTSVDFVAVSGGSSVTTTASGITTGIYKIAVGYNSVANGTVLYVNGTLRDTRTIAIPNLSAAVFGYGTRADGAAGTQFGDRIRAVALYTTRLTDAQLQALTT